MDYPIIILKNIWIIDTKYFSLQMFSKIIIPYAEPTHNVEH